MAEAPAPKKTLAETLEMLEKQLQCAICLETYHNPKALACLHVYCQECIQQLLLRQQKDEELECPQCHSIGPVVGNNAKSLPTVFFINSLIEIYEIMRKVESNEIACQNCSTTNSKATSFCSTRNMFICTSCNTAHQTMKAFAGHETLPISEMRDGTLIQLPKKIPPTSTCKKHERELLKFYCSVCKQLICRDCSVVDHTGHSLVSVKDLAADYREEILASLLPIRDTHVAITTAVTSVEDTKKAITDQGEDIAMTITQSFDQLKAILEERKEVLLHHVQEVMERKVGALDRQQRDLQVTLATLDSLVGFIEKTAEKGSDEEFISMKQQMTSRVQEVTSKIQNVELNPNEVADAFVNVLPPTHLERLCKRSFVASGPGFKSATTQQVAKFTLCSFDTHSQPCHAQQHASAKLKSLVNGSVLQTTVVSQTPSMYELSYTPTTRGRHQLTVRVGNTEIGTFQVFVHHLPTQLGTRVCKKKGGKPYNQGPNYIAGYLVTAQDLFRSEVLNTEGERVLTVEQHSWKTMFSPTCPTGIATDGDGNVYVASEDNKLRKFNREGEVVKLVEERGRNVGEFDCPNGVRYRNHQVYVCDSNNARVQVFNSDLKFIRSFGIHGDGPGQFKDPRDIDFDSQGHIYVVDSMKHQVLVFTEDGQYLHHFGKKGRDEGELRGPRGLCISGDYVYVAEESNCRVSVFHTSGQFVHSFGELEMDGPCGISIDQDGFVLVCDTVMNCVHVF